MRHLSLRLAASFFLLATSACKEAPPAPPMALEVFCGDTNKAPMTGDMRGPRGQVEGYIQLPKLFVMCDTTCLFQLAVDAPGQGAKLGASLRVGGGSNQIERLKKDFTAADVKINTLEGKPIDLTKPVKLSGHRLGNDAKSCVMVVDRIEQ